MILGLSAGTLLALRDSDGDGDGDRETVAPPPPVGQTDPNTAEEPMPRITTAPGESPRPWAMGKDVTISGRGDRTVDVGLVPDAVYVATITHDGTANFMVDTLGDGGRNVGLIVNAQGDYSGERTVGLAEFDTVAAVRVRADGNWKIVLRDVRKARKFTGKATGREPAVFLVPKDAGFSARLTLSYRGTGNYVIRGYGEDSRMGLLEDGIGPLSWLVHLPPDTRVIEVDTQGDWDLEVLP
ncbi:hypothetical protein SAMN05421812_102663 [Asanoa hainanensis]|uniref:Uncharacterized protein n=2 Tax=Asanoa hainanensis TaxID=560556 RepID=A0A239J0L7_9ACTN|nr:hypothetical protein SAMN05421812_102663 [Asanoa hainanensis]